MSQNPVSPTRQDEPVMVALVSAGLILIMTALVVLPALFLGFGPTFRQDRIESLALDATGLDGSWKKLEADPPFVSAWHHGKTGVFFFRFPLGTQDMSWYLVSGPKGKSIHRLQSSDPANMSLVSTTLAKMQTQLDAPEAMQAESNPDLRAREKAFADLVSRSQKILAGKGR